MSRIIDNYYCKLRDRLTNASGNGGIVDVATEYPITGDGVGNPVTLIDANLQGQFLYYNRGEWALPYTGSLIIGADSGIPCETGTNVGFGPYAMRQIPDSSLAQSNCSAFGYRSMENSNGSFGSTAFGAFTLQRIQLPGSNNSAFGEFALQFLETGSGNVGMGGSALRSLTQGDDNIGIGRITLQSLSTGSDNTVVGCAAGRFIVAAEGVTWIGEACGTSSPLIIGPIIDSTIVGARAISDYDNTIVLGADARATGPNSLTIGDANLHNGIVSTGDPGVATHSILIRIGTTSYRIPAILSP